MDVPGLMTDEELVRIAALQEDQPSLSVDAAMNMSEYRRAAIKRLLAERQHMINLLRDIGNDYPDRLVDYRAGYAAGVKAENEACAALADAHVPHHLNSHWIANKIRARSCQSGQDSGSPQQTPAPSRTRQEVLRSRRNANRGCCERWLDRMACDCLERAVP